MANSSTLLLSIRGLACKSIRSDFRLVFHATGGLKEQAKTMDVFAGYKWTGVFVVPFHTT